MNRRTPFFLLLIATLVIFTSGITYADPPTDPTPPVGYIYDVQTVHVTSFSQSTGSELLSNPGFNTWSSDNPSGWITFEYPPNSVVTESAPDGSSGTGAAHFISDASQSPTIAQVVLVPDTWQELTIDVTAFTSGSILLRDGAGYFPSLVAAGPAHMLIRPHDSALYVRAGFNPPHDFVLDILSLKTITENSVSTATADATTTLEFDLPASPVAYQQIDLRYRVVDAINYFAVRLQRDSTNTAWNTYLVRVVSGTETSLMSAIGVGTPDAIRVMVVGNSHQVYTGASGTFTARGGTITDSSHSTATGVTSLYSSDFTANSLSSYSIIPEPVDTPTPTATYTATYTPTPLVTPISVVITVVMLPPSSTPTPTITPGASLTPTPTYTPTPNLAMDVRRDGETYGARINLTATLGDVMIVILLSMLAVERVFGYVLRLRRR